MSRIAGLVHLSYKNNFADWAGKIGQVSIQQSDLLEPTGYDIFLAFDYDYDAPESTMQVVGDDFEDVMFLPVSLFVQKDGRLESFPLEKKWKKAASRDPNRHHYYSIRSAIRTVLEKFGFAPTELKILSDALLLLEFGFGDNDKAFGYAEEPELVLDAPIKKSDLKRIRYALYRDIAFISEERSCPRSDGIETSSLSDVSQYLYDGEASYLTAAYRLAVVM